MEKAAKSGPLTETDLEFLGYSDVLQDKAISYAMSSEGNIRVFSAHTSAGVEKVRHVFVYLQTAACNNKAMARMDDTLASSPELRNVRVFVVVPKSQSKIVSSRENARLFDDLIWDKLKEEFSGYVNDVKVESDMFRGAEQYVVPSLTCNGNPRSIKNLVDDMSSEGGNDKINVVKEHAGVGKTTLSAGVAGQLIERQDTLRVIPVFLTGRDRWKDLAEQAKDVSNLWDILHLALKQQGDFPLKKEEMVTRLIKLGYIALILDGFDELPAMSVTPRDHIAWLSNIMDNSEARIMLTARPSFWDRMIGGATSESSKCQEWKLSPFNRDNAYKYFDLRFPLKTDKNVKLSFPVEGNKAKDVYQYLSTISGERTSGKNFIELPAFVRAIADYVEAGGDVPVHKGSDKQYVIGDFFKEIIERERIRQDIKAPAGALLNALEDMSVNMSEFELEYLCLNDQDGKMSEFGNSKMKDFAFIQHLPETDKYKFKHEFLEHYFRSSCVRRLILAGDEESGILEQYQNNSMLRGLIDNEQNGSGQLCERVADFLDMKDMDKVADVHKKANRLLKNFLFHVIINVCCLHNPGESRADRAEIAMGYLGADMKEKNVSDLYVCGRIGDISIQGWTFSKSTFNKLVLEARDSKEGKEATFTKCYFIGITEIPYECHVLVDDKCTGDSDAILTLDKHREHLDMSEDEIRHRMKKALSRFWVDGRHVRTISSDEWKTGVTKDIEERFELLNILKKVKFIEVNERNRIRVCKNRIGEFVDFMENGAVRGVIKQVFDEMKKKEGRAK